MGINHDALYCCFMKSCKITIIFNHRSLHMRGRNKNLKIASYSCQPGRRSAYHSDLRWRMIWQREVQGLSLQRVDSNLSVDPSTVQRTTRRFELSGTVDKKRYIHLVLKKPGIYLKEIQQDLLWQFDLDISAASLCNFLKKSNFTRKKMQLIALQRDKELRSAFLSDVSIYNSIGCDRRDAIRRYGYGVRGKRVKCQKLLVRGERISAIAAMTTEGLLDVKIVRGSVTGDKFNEFVEKQFCFT